LLNVLHRIAEKEAGFKSLAEPMIVPSREARYRHFSRI
jgi:hypothetical protein